MKYKDKVAQMTDAELQEEMERTRRLSVRMQVATVVLCAATFVAIVLAAVLT